MRRFMDNNLAFLMQPTSLLKALACFVAGGD
jgi:hypothetical protein